MEGGCRGSGEEGPTRDRMKDVVHALAAAELAEAMQRIEAARRAAESVGAPLVQRTGGAIAARSCAQCCSAPQPADHAREGDVDLFKLVIPMPAVACCTRALVAQRDAIDTGSDELRNFWLQLQPWSCAWPRLLGEPAGAASPRSLGAPAAAAAVPRAGVGGGSALRRGFMGRGAAWVRLTRSRGRM